jgi:hypothetical protein
MRLLWSVGGSLLLVTGGMVVYFEGPAYLAYVALGSGFGLLLVASYLKKYGPSSPIRAKSGRHVH